MDERVAADMAMLKDDASVFWMRLYAALDGVEPPDIPLHAELRDVAEELRRLANKLCAIAFELAGRK